MKREQLKELGIADDLIDKVMDLNGKDIEPLKTKAESLQGELTKANNALTDVNTKLKAFDGVDVEGMKTTIAQLNDKYNSDVTTLKLDFAIKEAVKELKPHKVEAVMPFLDKSLVKLDTDGKVLGLTEQLTKIKTDNAFLFATEEPAKLGADGKPIVVNTGGSHGGGGAVDTEKMTDAEYYAHIASEASKK
jgi:hypothetical protein